MMLIRAPGWRHTQPSLRSLDPAATGVIVWEEIAEMSALVLLVVWNIRRRHLAFASLSRIAGRDRSRVRP